MRVALVRIGNSRGIRIPRPIIEQCRLGDTVEVNVENGRLVIVPERRPREGWVKAFRLLLEMPPIQFDRKEWEW